MRRHHYLVMVCAVACFCSTGCSRKQHMEAHNRGATLLAQGDANGAIEAFKEAASHGPADPQTVCGLARAFALAGEAQQAIDSLSVYLTKRPDTICVTELLAHLQIEQGNLEQARNVLEKAPKMTPRMLVQDARIAFLSDNVEEASDLLRRVLLEAPDYPPALYNMAMIYRSNPDTIEEAEATFLRFREAAPGDHRAGATIEEFLSGLIPEPMATNTGVHDTARLDERYAQLLADAQQAAEEGSTDEADVLLRKAIKSYPDRPDALWQRAELYYRIQRMPEQAATMYARFKELFPEDSRIASIPADLELPAPRMTARTAEEFLQEGLRHYDQENWTAAIKAYRNALELSPGYATASYNLGLAYKGAKRFDDAAAAFRDATEADPSKVKAWYMLGVTEMARGHTAAALETLNKLLADHPDYARAHYLLGILYDRADERNAARTHFGKYLEMEQQGDAATYVRQWLTNNPEGN